MELRQFFQQFLQVKDPELIRKETFLLSYGTKGGFTYGDIMEMEPSEREAYLEVLNEQLERENREIKRAQGKTKGGSRTRRPHRRLR